MILHKTELMRKLLIAAFLLSLVWSCQKDEEPDYTKLIRGVWVNTHVNDVSVGTDEAFVMEFRSDFKEVYASGLVVDDSNRTWVENDKFSYAVEENKLIINGQNDAGNIFSMEFKILQADETTLRYVVNKFVVDNVSYPDTKTYTCKRVTTDLKQQFVGTWYGRCTTPGHDSSYHYWDYFADGTYDYYYQDSANQWINKQDNESRYHLYGDYLATLYSNDLLSGAVGTTFECWNIRIEGNRMYWNGLREGGITIRFEMDKVAGPPGG